MPYCTQADIQNYEVPEKELIQLTDDDNTGDVDQAMVTAAIAKADAEIDAHCQAQYTVPFSTVPVIVRGWSATLAAFNLYRNKPKPTTLIDRYNKVMSWLGKVAEGKQTIPGATDDSSLPESTTDGCSQTFRKTQTDAAGTVIETGTMDTW